MNIACDARALVGFHTGVSTWVTQVMGGLARRHGHRVTLAASKPLDRPRELDLPNIEVLPPPRPAIPGTLWLHTVLPERLRHLGADVFVGSLAIIPRRCPIPAVSMVHDITPRTHPRHHTLANRFCFNAYLEESLERAAAVVALSKASEALLRKHVPSIRAPVVHIGAGVDRFFTPADSDDDGTKVRDRYSDGRPYLLHLGTIEPRKGIAHLVAAWDRLHDLVGDPPDLVLAGGEGWNTGPILKRLEASPNRSRIHVPGYVDRSDARDLLRHAAAFVLASEVEGFGLPLAEAISCGTVCIASDVPALRETGGDAALYSPPGAAERLATAMAAALEPATAGELRRRAVHRAVELRWEPVVDTWNDLLQSVVSGSRR